jgi:hypothetical protein
LPSADGKSEPAPPNGRRGSEDWLEGFTFSQTGFVLFP